jgi:hypothetical protein
MRVFDSRIGRGLYGAAIESRNAIPVRPIPTSIHTSPLHPTGTLPNETRDLAEDFAVSLDLNLLDGAAGPRCIDFEQRD